MTTMAQSELHDFAAAYALDALDPEDRWTYERHLDTCERCREEVSALRETGTEMAYATEGPEPSPKLKGRILLAARAEPQMGAVVPMRRRWLLPATSAMAVAAACAAVGLGLWANSLRDEVGRQQIVAFEGNPGRLIVSGKQATLVMCVPEAPAGKSYEAWVFENDVPRAAAVFGGGCRSVELGLPVKQGNTVAVTLEKAGGVEAPQGDILMSADV